MNIHNYFFGLRPQVPKLLADQNRGPSRRRDYNQQASLLVRPAPIASRKLEGEKLGSPAFGCHARSLGCRWRFTS